MGPKTVLLVDPHKDSRVVYATLLSHSGFRVLEAVDDEEGIRLACAQEPDVILTELFPWGKGGKMLPERLHEAPETSRIPVIALTAHLVPDAWAEALLRSGARVLTKPCGPSRVLEEVRSLL
jgi:CheY-like chemotaxis protein